MEHDLFGKPVFTFPDHALAERNPALSVLHYRAAAAVTAGEDGYRPPPPTIQDEEVGALLPDIRGWARGLIGGQRLVVAQPLRQVAEGREQTAVIRSDLRVSLCRWLRRGVDARNRHGFDLDGRGWWRRDLHRRLRHRLGDGLWRKSPQVSLRL
jgi:hypothetical protein